MEIRKSLVIELAEVIDRHLPRHAAGPEASTEVAPTPGWLAWLGRQLLPNLGSVLLVLILLSVFPGLAAPNVPSATSISTIPYQGRLADAAGNPITGKQNMEFRVYDVPTGGAPLWTEFWTGGNAVNISDGLFSVMLGSIQTGLATIVQANDELYLGVTVGTDAEMKPRVQLGSVPFSMVSLTVPDGSVTTAKIANGAVTTEKLDIDNGLEVTGDIILTGTLQGMHSYWADYRSYLRFLSEGGATTNALCPEGGIPVGVTGPKQSLELLTGNDICQHNYDMTRQTCVNVHRIAPCGSIIGNHFPYNAESCNQKFSGQWAPFYWWNADSTHDVTYNILGSGIGCFGVRYACCNN